MLSFITFTEILSNVAYVLLAFLILMFMVTIHELGHYTAGKLLKFKINEFAIGMGPKIFKRKMKSGEDFSVRVLPLGGFCAFEGEDEDGEDPAAFNRQKPWKRLIVLFSGAFFNFLSAILIAVIAFSCFGDQLPSVHEIYNTSPNYSAEASANTFRQGDVILAINGKTIYLANDIGKYIASAPEEMSVLVLRDGEKVLLEGIRKGNYTITKDDKTQTYFGWGISMTYGDRIRYSFGEALTRSAPYCFRVGGYVLETLGGLVTGLIGLDQIGGPITTLDITMQIMRTGFANVLFLITLISVNLAVFNLLPLPALDGSRMLFVVIEWIRKKPINRNVEGWIHAVGLILLLIFVIAVDLLHLFG